MYGNHKTQKRKYHSSVAKNVVLGGVKSVTLHDSGNVEMSDLSSQVNIKLAVAVSATLLR